MGHRSDQEEGSAWWNAAILLSGGGLGTSILFLHRTGCVVAASAWHRTCSFRGQVKVYAVMQEMEMSEVAEDALRAYLPADDWV